MNSEDGRVKEVGTGGTVRRVSTNLTRLVVELEGRFCARAGRDLIVTSA
jgi:hypothetical protein